ncbi:DUF3606 domain-containing protein [Sphingomonas sp. NCPPB 2930]
MTTTPSTTGGTQPDRIDMADAGARAEWAEKFDVSEEQLQDAVKAAGDRATDVEMHLKGSRSITNADRIEELGAGN